MARIQEPPEPGPVEDLRDRQLVDAVGRLADRLLQHGARVAVRLRLLRVGQLDRGDEPIAELLGEAAFENDGDGRVAELAHQTHHEPAGDQVAEPGEHQNGDDRSDPERAHVRRIDEVEFEHPVEGAGAEQAEVEGEPEPEPTGDAEHEDRGRLREDVAADEAAHRLERMLHPCGPVAGFDFGSHENLVHVSCVPCPRLCVGMRWITSRSSVSRKVTVPRMPCARQVSRRMGLPTRPSLARDEEPRLLAVGTGRRPIYAKTVTPT